MGKTGHLIIYAFLALFSICCQQEPGTLSLPDNSINKNYRLAFTDTTSLITSTVLLDSVPTSNRGMLLIGKYKDERLGVVDARAYFGIGVGGTWTIPDDAVYDSTVLIMDFQGYFYGDLTQSQTIEVRQIVQDFKTYNLSEFWKRELLYSYFSNFANSLYNNSSIKVNEAEVLGTATYTPNPIIIVNTAKTTTITTITNTETISTSNTTNSIFTKSDSISVRLNDALGESWFQTAREGASALNQTINLFRGVEIRGLQESNIVGVQTLKNQQTLSSTLRIRVFYHELDNAVMTQKHYDFPFINGLYNYTKISTDRSGTPLVGLTHQNNIIASSLTNEETFVQSGVGLVTKITFPTLKKMLNIPGFISVNSARLIIEPVKHSYDNNNLPPTLTLFRTNGTNLPLAQVPADFSTGGVQNASIAINKETDTNSGYSFSITQIIQSLLNNTQSSTKDVAFLLSTPVADMGNAVTRATLGSGQNTDYRVRIEIYYLKQNE